MLFGSLSENIGGLSLDNFTVSSSEIIIYRMNRLFPDISIQTTGIRRQIFKYDTVIPILMQLIFLINKIQKYHLKTYKKIRKLSFHVDRITL